jgi:glycosyltransferase involved in cell wall biosynthesis
VIVGARARETSRHRTPGGWEVRVGEFGRAMSVPIAPTFPVWQRRLAPDLVHLHMPNPTGELSTLMTTRRNTPVVVSYHADIVRQARLTPVYRLVVDACLNRAQAIVVGSSRLTQTSPFLRRHSRNVVVIPYGVDVDYFDRRRVPQPQAQAIRERYGTPLAVAVGRLVYYKGFEYLVEAARTLNASVVIVGTGPLESRLRRQARGTPRVYFVGRLSDEEHRRHLAAADCFVLPSANRAESFGIATVEAQAMGLPAVVTEVGTGTTEAIEPNVTGLSVPACDPERLSAALRSLLVDSDRLAAMGTAARERAERRFSARAQAERLRELYEQVLQQGRR